MSEKFVIGVDFGTDSVRAIIVDTENGNEIATAVSYYSRWSRGLYCDPSQNRFRQHPLDYIEGLETVIEESLEQAGKGVRKGIAGISIATTGSTPVAVNKAGIPLGLTEPFQNNPNAMFVLWKDHTAIREAEEINQTEREFETKYLKYVGGTYSSEWYWAKLLHILREDKSVKEACYTWVEHSDWIPFLLTGDQQASQIKRNVCAAGHKALWASEFGGFPSEDFFRSIDPILLPFIDRFGQQVFAADQPAGQLSEEWAAKWGLTTEVVIGIGAIDAHMGAVGGKIKPYFMSKVIGTSTCDMMVVPKSAMEDVFVEGISGQVEDSIIPGMVGLEAGQSAFGDIYSWFKDLLLWPAKTLSNNGSKEEGDDGAVPTQLEVKILEELGRQAADLQVEEHSEFALDWFNGRRSPDADPNVKGLIGGLTLGTTAPKIYHALVEATCFGSKAIMESMEAQEIEIRGIDAIGGIATKSEFVMQVMADVLNRTVSISPVEQTVALGAAMFAAVAGGVYRNVEEAGEAMGASSNNIIAPRKEFVNLYSKRYEQYKRYGEMQ